MPTVLASLPSSQLSTLAVWQTTRARREVSVSDEHFQEVSTFSSDFFDGRVNESIGKKAEIEIEFTVKQDKYRIVRGAFEPNQLRYASVNGNALTGSPTSKNDAYKQSMAESVGVANFEQFVFLQLFVFTFDEQRI